MLKNWKIYGGRTCKKKTKSNENLIIKKQKRLNGYKTFIREEISRDGTCRVDHRI